MHLIASSNGQGGSNQHNSTGGQDVLVKSSSDVKVRVNFLILEKRKEEKRSKQGPGEKYKQRHVLNWKREKY